MGRITYERMVTAFNAFVQGFKQPDFIVCSTDAWQELYELLFGQKGLSKYPPVWRNEKWVEFWVTGFMFESAVVIRDARLPQGTINFENHSDPTNPYLNGTWHLDENPRVLYRQEMKRA